MIGLMVAAVLAMGLALVSEGIAQQTQELRIGLVLPFTGPAALLADEGFAGADIAREIINERGGALGKKVVFVKADAPDPAAGVNEVERLISREKLTAILGSYASSISLATTQAAERTASSTGSPGRPQTPSPSAASSTRSGSRPKFPSSGSAPPTTRPPRSRRRSARRRRRSKVAIVHEDSAFGTGGANAAEKKAKEHGFTVVAEGVVPADDGGPLAAYHQAKERAAGHRDRVRLRERRDP